ncbi:MAG TPA: type II toxin-antitoxin system VapC family toxin [Longimicrobium sp.]|jgi:predicted nucleic acid-binding protein|nr:type II toxin-antitoxin system VapC family toxin [Longimicrobium sp.]
MIFFDASAIVKAYVPEPGSPSVHGAIARMKGELYLTRAVALEALATFAKKRRKDELTKGEYRVARDSFLRALEVTFTLFEIREADFSTAFKLVDDYRDVGVGPMDVLHIATALQLRAKSADPVTVASSDGPFLAVARAAGLPTFDPETQPLRALIAQR